MTNWEIMKFWKFFAISFLCTGSLDIVHSLGLNNIVPFGRSESRLPNGATQSRDRSRYRHAYPINPIIRTAGNNQTFAPVLWDLAPQSYPVDFFLYTKDNPYLPEEINVGNATDSKYFDRGKPTKVIIHDFMQSTENRLVHDLKDAYMNKKEDHNVILVDWEPARTYTYTVAVTVSEYVGKMTARLIQVMKIDAEKVHVIGFGLGAHAGGVLGNELKIRYNMTLGRITGLDPSLPLFRMAGDYFKLDPEDAAFVDVIHTDGGDNLWNSNHLGMGKELGHIDIYPNRGIFQPGCRQSNLPSYDTLMCSHTRALEIYRESIEDPLSFVACRCPTWTDFTDNRCNCMQEGNRIFVGEACSSSAPRGNYYLVTNEAPPYGLGGQGTVPVLTRAADPGSVMNTLFNPVNGSFIQGISQIAHIFTAPIKPLFNTLVQNAGTINAAVDSNHINGLRPQNNNPFNNLFGLNNNNNNPSNNIFRNIFNNNNNNNNQQQQFGNNNNNFNNQNSVRETHQNDFSQPPPPPLFHQDTLIYNENPPGVGRGMMNFNPTPAVPLQYNLPPPPPNY